MKRIILLPIFLLLVSLLSVQAQLTPARQQVDQYGRDQYGNQVDPSMRPENLDSTNVEVQGLPPKLYMWRIHELLGNRTIIPADTVYHHFQNSNFTEGVTGHYNHLANLGSPRLSHLFFERVQQPSPTIFMESFSSFFLRPDQFNFTNSNVPYTNLTYHKAGDKLSGDERFKSYFSVNANKRLAFGFNIDYLYGRGFYNHQNTAYFNATLFGSYIGDRYQLQTMYSNNFLKTNENGGITDDRYITAPEEMAGNKKEYESKDIPTVLNKSTNRNKDFYIYLNHRYNLGFKKEIPVAENDTTPPKQEFVPVTSFIHTFKLERSRHLFNSEDDVKDYYKETFLAPETKYVRDSTTYVGITNTFGLALVEGFNKYAKAGLTAFASHRMKKYSLMSLDATRLSEYTENEIYVGGELSKREGHLLHYHAIGEVGVAGKALGQFDVKGDLDLNFSLWKDTVSLVARGMVSHKVAPFYMRHYHSKHFWWDDELDKEFRTRIEGELTIERWKTKLQAGVENIKNYTYFNELAKPQQYSGNIQLLSATVKQDFQVGLLHLDNEVVWQKTSNETVLPLPDLSLYHNLYLQFKVAKKVLSVQLGADVRYFTEYYAPAYMPATQQFHLQSGDKIKIGGYPVVNVYANLHLKRTRIYVMMTHVNQGMGKSNYFMAPHYPINPRVLEFGLSWNLYD
ncbi:MAG: hypothetical protein EOM31_04275 [Bacteroidia bacterium]|nr:hypothetical protein [Bacteroidia bacterium]